MAKCKVLTVRWWKG